jgi:hypothetical protein
MSPIDPIGGGQGPSPPDPPHRGGKPEPTPEPDGDDKVTISKEARLIKEIEDHFKRTLAELMPRVLPWLEEEEKARQNGGGLATFDKDGNIVRRIKLGLPTRS